MFNFVKAFSFLEIKKKIFCVLPNAEFYKASVKLPQLNYLPFFLS